MQVGDYVRVVDPACMWDGAFGVVEGISGCRRFGQALSNGITLVRLYDWCDSIWLHKSQIRPASAVDVLARIK